MQVRYGPTVDTNLYGCYSQGATYMGLWECCKPDADSARFFSCPSNTIQLQSALSRKSVDASQHFMERDQKRSYNGLARR